MGQITRDALMNWNGLRIEDAEKQVQEYGSADIASNNVTYGSELNSIKGIAQAIGLTEEQINQLVAKLSMGAEFYPILEGLETNKGVNGGEKTPITELLKDFAIVEKMATQVEERIVMPSMSLESKETELKALESEEKTISEAERLMKSLEKGKDRDSQQIGG